MSRECGSCVECCTALAVHEIAKPGFQRCDHAARGCGIYQTRPESCREFSCLWLGGHFARSDRPDRLGIVFATAEMESGQVVIAYVSQAGADRTPRGAGMLRTVAAVIPLCILRRNGTRTVMAPPHLASRVPGVIREFVETKAEVGPDGRLRRLPLV